MIAFIIQCADEPRLWPLERTRLGNTSAIYTQMTAPWETEKNRYSNQQPNQSFGVGVGEEDGRDAGQASGHADAADKKQRFRPSLSMSDMPNKVANRFISPNNTVCSELDNWLKPAEANT